MNRLWLDEVTAALHDVEADSSAGALVTTGDGKFYSNGFDLEWLMKSDTELMVASIMDVERLLARMLAFPLTAVATCNGHTFAGGAILALCHDFRVMRVDRGFFACLKSISRSHLRRGWIR